MPFVKSAKPPQGLIHKFFFYAGKYGLLHTVFGFIGRHNLTLWKIIAPILTQRYIREWEKNNDFRIVNLGGGSNCLEKCLSVDIDPRSDAYTDITKRLPFSNESINAIFCEEVIEHVSLAQGSYLLKECWRVLKPGGYIRLTTPDLNWFASRVSESKEACAEMNSIFYDHNHCYLYTQKMLWCAVQESDFANLKPSSYQDSTSQLGYLDSHADRFQHPSEASQYLEAQRPV